MRWKRLRRAALPKALLSVLLPVLLLLSLAELQVTARDVRHAANAAYDRSLLGALKSVDASVSTESGGLSVELPYRLFEFFELTASGAVHYRVATADGLVELGSADLPAPPSPLRAGVPQFYDGEYFGEPVRVVALQRALEPGAARQMVIQVAESTRARQDFTRVFLRRAVVENTLFLLLTVSLAVVAVIVVLRPLGALSREIGGRGPGDLSPLPAHDLPADVRPLAEAMNQHMRRIDELAHQQRAFLDDASHQLRTHLTTMRMQVDYTLREDDPAQARAATQALADELQRAMRSTNQLLSLARSDTAPLAPAAFEPLGLLQDVARQLLPQARAKGLDLGVEAEPAIAWGDEGLLREAVLNLAANAIAYVPAGSVTLSAAQDSQGFALTVEDDGPGLPPDLQRGEGTRFVRAAGTSPAGAGLGLAIARAIAARHGGALRLEAGGSGRGLRATLWWPRPPRTGAST
jgi:two-component system sensor histidine kinase TctE